MLSLQLLDQMAGECSRVIARYGRLIVVRCAINPEITAARAPDVEHAHVVEDVGWALAHGTVVLSFALLVWHRLLR